MSIEEIFTPGFTATPHEFYDKWLPDLDYAEVKVLLTIIRQTLGCDKNEDCISLSQLQEKTGLQKKHIITAVKNLQEKGIINKKIIGANGTQKTYYKIILSDPIHNFV